MLSCTVDQRLELVHALAEPGPQLLVDLGGNRLENGERAAQRKRDQRQIAGRRRVRRLDQRVVDGRNLLLRLLLRDVGGNRLRQVRRRRRASLRRERRVGRGRSPLRELGVHHEDAGRHEALACVRRSRQAAQQLLLARNHVEPGGDEIVERLRGCAADRSPPLRSRPPAPCSSVAPFSAASSSSRRAISTRDAAETSSC